MTTMSNNVSLAVTGLRAHKLFGSHYSQGAYVSIVNFNTQFLNERPFITQVNIGMATGIDLLFGLAAVRSRKMRGNLRIVAYIPGTNQTKYYNAEEKRIYDFLVKQADEIIHVSKQPCTGEVLKKTQPSHGKRQRLGVGVLEWSES